MSPALLPVGPGHRDRAPGPGCRVPPTCRVALDSARCKVELDSCQAELDMNPISGLIDQAASKCEPANDSALAKRMHVSRSAVSLWRKGGTITEKHLTALIVLADVDEVTALKVLEAQAETKPQKAVWSALLHRLGATAALVLCAIGLAIGASPGALAHKRFADHSVKNEAPGADECLLCKGDWGWWAQLVRWWLAWKLRGSRSTTWSPTACSAA